MGGHDHMHDRAIVASPVDHLYNVQNLVLASDSSKFYIPYGSNNFAYRTVDPTTKAVTTSTTQVTTSPDPTQTNDYIYNVLVAGRTTRETQISQELNTVGYYIFTVDGPKVTAEYYSAIVNPSPVLTSGIPAEYLISTTPTMTFARRETFGYSLNGHEYLVAQGQSYAVVNETYAGTTAKILSGINGSAAKDSAGRPLTKTVNTGWAPRTSGTLSDIVTLWGLADLGTATTDTYAISVSYDPTTVTTDAINHGHPAYLAAKDASGNWVKAASGKFVVGPYNAKYPLGFHGIDTTKNIAWAVVNAPGGDFTVIQP
jgi:hypothetical protein